MDQNSQQLRPSQDEYVIWGIPPHKDVEELLIANPHGRPITSKSEAELFVAILIHRIGCTNVRIQKIDLTTAPDFVGTINQ